MKNILLIISSVYLILMGCLFGFFSIIADMPLAISLFLYLVSALAIIIGVGIFLRKNWARILLLIISSLKCLIGSVLFLVVIFLSRTNILFAMIPRDWVFGLMAIFMLAIPLFFLIFFQNSLVKSVLFKVPLTITPPKKPFVLWLIAIFWFSNAGSFSLLLLDTSIKEIPFIGNVFLSGWALIIYLIVLTAIAVYNGIALLRMQAAAWVSNLIMLGCFFLITALNVFFMTEEVLVKIGNGLPSGISFEQYRMASCVGLVLPAVIIIYLVHKKDLFSRSTT